MDPQDAQARLDDLPSLGADDWLHTLIARSGAEPPRLLPLLGWLPQLPQSGTDRPGDAPASDPARRLSICLEALLHLAPRTGPHSRLLPWSALPWHQVRRVAAAVLAGQLQLLPPPRDPAVQAAAAAATKPGLLADLPPAVQGHAEQAAACTAGWLQHCSDLGPLSLPPFGAWQPPGVEETVQLPVALIGADGAGFSATLTLHRVAQPTGAGLCLAPAPASALLLRCGPEWDAALADVQAQVAALLGPAALQALQRTAIAWDLARTGSGALAAISGPSASASLALGMLWLLRAHAPTAWQALLLRLTAADLSMAAASAALGPGFSLLPVAGTLDKAQALHALLQALASHPDAPRLVLHVSHLQGLPSAPSPGQVPQQPHPDLLHLLQHLADQADPLSDDQACLLQALLQPGDAPPRLDDPLLLQRVHQAPVHTLRQYLLHCWAAFDRQLRGQVYQRFVPLRLQADPGNLAHPGLLHTLQGLQGPFPGGLQDLLARVDGSGVEAYVLTGEPGSGKTTLLRHHLQHCARAVLRRLCLPPARQAAAAAAADVSHVGGDADALPPPGHELPVVLSLNRLPHEVDTSAGIVQWALQQLASFPPELVALLQGGGAWAGQGLRARLLLDGLNELQVAHADARPARAAQVVHALHAHVAASRQGVPLPLLLSIRPRHAWRLAPLVTLPVQLGDWDDTQIGDYVALRFAHLPDAGKAHWQALRQVPPALALCRRPLHLALQCDLLDDGFDAPPQDRAALYTAWLWLALRRALNADGRHPAHHDPALWEEAPGAGPDAVLLTAADRRAIESADAWRSGRMAQLPLQGQLLRCLLQQADAQWRAATDPDARLAPDAAATAPPVAERLAAPVPWSGVATHLPPALRDRFGRAVDALGLALVDAAAGTWQFRHHSWGEFLAACRLLQDGPPADAELLRRLDAVPPPHASDVAQLQALAGGGPAWRSVPAEAWAQLLRDGLEVDLQALVDSKFSDDLLASTDAATRLADFRARLAVDYIERRALHLDERQGRAHARLAELAAATGVDDALGLAPGGWQHTPAGWQFLMQQRLFAQFPPFEQAFQVWLGRHGARWGMASELPRRLQVDRARLDLPPQPEGAEVLALALQGQDDAGLCTWLQALLADDRHTLWPALQPVLPALQARLEPHGASTEHAPHAPPESGPSGRSGRSGPGTGPAPAAPGPHPLLQHLRQVLLLTMLDAGAASLAGVKASGMLGLLDTATPVGLPRPLRRRWQALRAAAFLGDGQRLAVRLQAGLLLGQLGDTIRYERRLRSTAAGDWGLRPRRALWALVGDREEHSVHAIGSPAGQGLPADESPPWSVSLAGFEACRLPLTVAEWRCFWRTPAGQAYGWTVADDPDFNNPLQPVTGISWRAARAYAEWARPLHADWQAAEQRAGLQPWQPALPTELQWEAAARAPAPPPSLRERLAGAWAGLRGRAQAADPTLLTLDGPAQDLAFNHANTRWLRPSPVGCFSRSFTAAGLADVRGNVWEWCASTLTRAQRQRGWASDADRLQANRRAVADTTDDLALRGGAYDVTADDCRPAIRNLFTPGNRGGDVGVRLVRLWLPHSGPRTP